MKKQNQFLLLATLVVFGNSLFAQKWDVNGNSIGPTNFLGTINNQPLNFQTNGTQRMTILGPTGFVGIVWCLTKTSQTLLQSKLLLLTTYHKV